MSSVLLRTGGDTLRTHPTPFSCQSAATSHRLILTPYPHPHWCRRDMYIAATTALKKGGVAGTVCCSSGYAGGTVALHHQTTGHQTTGDRREIQPRSPPLPSPPRGALPVPAAHPQEGLGAGIVEYRRQDQLKHHEGRQHHLLYGGHADMSGVQEEEVGTGQAPLWAPPAFTVPLDPTRHQPPGTGGHPYQLGVPPPSHLMSPPPCVLASSTPPPPVAAFDPHPPPHYGPGDGSPVLMSLITL